jgi:hypothetical protein
MRADMGKVLVERPRLGSRDGSRPKKGYRKRLQKAFDSGDPLPVREGMKVRCGRGKHFNEHLGPLRRFLNSNVGRQWDKISMARQVANAASNAACFSTKLAAVWIMRTVKSDTESLGGHSRIPLQSALGRRGEPGKRSSQPGNSPTRDEKRLGNSGFQ